MSADAMRGYLGYHLAMAFGALMFVVAVSLLLVEYHERHRIYIQKHGSHVVHTLSYPMNESLDDTKELQKAIDEAGPGGTMAFPQGQTETLQVVPPLESPAYKDHTCFSDAFGKTNCK